MSYQLPAEFVPSQDRPAYVGSGGWTLEFTSTGYTIHSPNDGPAAWASTLAEGVAKIEELRAEGVWR